MKKKRLVLGGGCFWCIEAVYNNIKGVFSAISSYAGGARENPTYEQICTGVSGHAEVVDIEFDSDIISREELLNIFFSIHNPTTLNQQDADKGTQYRSVIYYENEQDKELILKVIGKQQENFVSKIVTEVSELPKVFKAEDYHQNYYRLNSIQGYCQAVIAPKLKKFMGEYPEVLG